MRTTAESTSGRGQKAPALMVKGISGLAIILHTDRQAGSCVAERPLSVGPLPFALSIPSADGLCAPAKQVAQDGSGNVIGHIGDNFVGSLKKIGRVLIEDIAMNQFHIVKAGQFSLARWARNGRLIPQLPRDRHVVQVVW